MKSGIYKIEDKKGRIYIGSAVDIKSRWRVHKHDLNNNKHSNSKLQHAWNKHGPEYFTFTVIEYCVKDMLIHYEQIWLDVIFNSLDREYVYNHCKYAGNMLGYKFSKEVIEKHADAISKDWSFIDPDGKEIHIRNLNKFCRENNLNMAHMSKVFHGQRKTHRGYKKL